VIFSVVYLLVRCLLGCLMVLAGFGRTGAGDRGSLYRRRHAALTATGGTKPL